jgi:TolA-binding protein
MLFTLKHQSRVTALEHKLSYLEGRIEMLSKALANQNSRLVSLEDARYGMKIDGTPKAKPGRKAKS